MVDQVGRQVAAHSHRQTKAAPPGETRSDPTPRPLHPSRSTTASSAPPGAEGGVWQVRGLRSSTSPG